MAESILANKKNRCVVFTILAALSILWGFGEISAQQWMTRHYNEHDGLGNSRVYDIAQDTYGRMWFATWGGISCYDGVSWKNFDGWDGLSSSRIEKVREDNQGRLWAAANAARTRGIHVAVFDGKHWEPIPPYKDDVSDYGSITALRFMYTEGDEAQTIPVIGTANKGVFYFQNREWIHLDARSGLSSSHVNGIAVLDNKCYVATDAGISIVSPGKPVDNRLNRSLHLPSSRVKGIYIQPHRPQPRIWLYGHGWLMYFDSKGNRRLYQPLPFEFGATEKPVLLMPDPYGGMYIANKYEVFYYDLQRRESQLITSRNGLISEGGNRLFMDFENNIWIACDRGLTKISGRHLVSFGMKDGLLEDEVTAIDTLPDGSFIFGHNSGFTYYDGQEFRRKKFSSALRFRRTLARVLDLRTDRKGNVWATLSRSGLLKIDPAGNMEIFSGNHGLRKDVTSVWVDDEDRVWVGAIDGLYLKQGSRFVPVLEDKRPGLNIRRLFGIPGEIYIATSDEGVYIYHPKSRKLERYRAEGFQDANNVYAVTVFPVPERLLVGTLGGLYLLDRPTGKFEPFQSNGFQLRRTVYFILKDLRGQWWFGTDDGVVRWDGNRAVGFSTPEGLIGQETNRAAGMVDKRGRIWIGTNRGVSIYDQRFDVRETKIPRPRLRLIHLEADEQVFPLDRPLEISSGAGNLVFRFRGISFSDENAIRFRHKLEGFDKDWLEEHYPYRQEIRYTNLLPGVYRFHVKVKNTMGIWSESVVSPSIRVLQPFYKRWWFILSIIVIVIFIIYSIVSYFSERRHAALLEEEVEQRTSQLEASEKKYRELFEESRDVVFTATVEGKFIDINPAGVELFGYDSREELLQVDIPSTLYADPSQRELFYKEIKENGFVKDYYLVMKTKEGDRIDLLVTATALLDEDGQVVADRGFIKDITATKRLREQLEQAQKMEAIGRLAGGIAHDFNNILAVITGYIELALDDIPVEMHAHQDIQQVLIASNRARELVTQILTFSRRSGQEQKPLILAPIINEALKLLRSSLPATIEIRKNIGDESGIVLADPTHIHQVMMNLCTNAAYAMQENGGMLEVSLEEIYLDEKAASLFNDLGAGDYIKLTVSDTGHGIKPAVIKRIFEPYFTTKPRGKGSGMGLAVTHGIVKGCGGDIKVYSEVGKGTTFHILLPVVRAMEEMDIPGETEIPRGNNEHILLVDDEDMLVEVEQQALIKLGYRVTTFTDSREALAGFRSQPDRYQLVITDLTMPHMTGVQLAAELQRIRPGLPVILCTGFSEAITLEQVKNLGISDLLMKPINRANLAAAVHKALGKN